MLKVLLVHGSGDVASVAAHLPQDRSVVSRQLQTLEDAGVVRSAWQGRHRVYALDGTVFVSRFELLASRLRALAPLCCPPSDAPIAAPTAPKSAAKTVAKSTAKKAAPKLAVRAPRRPAAKSR